MHIIWTVRQCFFCCFIVTESIVAFRLFAEPHAVTRCFVLIQKDRLDLQRFVSRSYELRRTYEKLTNS